MVDPNLVQGVVFLGAAVVMVPVARRLGLGSVVGYLIAGAAIGPFGLRLLGLPPEDVMHFAEFGVVMMLFLIGLELSPAKLWRLRKLVFGLGAAQIALTTAAIAAALVALGLDGSSGLIIALSLALSSTAVATQTLEERGEFHSPAGQAGLATLLMQDIAVIPILALIPFLAGSAGSGDDTNPWLNLGLVILSAGGIILGGRLITHPFFRFVARTGQRELFTALSLLLVIGAALTMSAVGVSPALGAFLGGVVLAESEYRHEIESDLEPFKGLLLGIFFMSVGASIDMDRVVATPGLVLAGVAGLLIIKFGVLVILARFIRLTTRQAVQLGLTLSQGSEFAFVLLAFAGQEGALTPEWRSLIVIVVGLSMFMTPLLLWLFDRWRSGGSGAVSGEETNALPEESRPVIICGFGRFGQIIGRLLLSNRIPVTLLDQDPARIQMLREFGFDVHYGDASRLDLLRAAGAENARLIVLAMDDRDKINAMVPSLRRHFPGLQIAARAIDRGHLYELLAMDVTLLTRETFESAISLGRQVLGALGLRAYEAKRSAERFKRRDRAEIEELRHLQSNPEAYRSRARAMIDDLHRLLDVDQAACQDVDHAWETGREVDHPVVEPGRGSA